MSASLPSALPPDPFKALGVLRDASAPAIKSAYRKLVLRIHPDKCTDETLKKEKMREFHLVQQAYEILSDDVQKDRYLAEERLDRLRNEKRRRQEESKATGSKDSGATKTGRVMTTYTTHGTTRRSADSYYEDRYYSETSRRYESYNPVKRDLGATREERAEEAERRAARERRREDFLSERERWSREERYEKRREREERRAREERREQQRLREERQKRRHGRVKIETYSTEEMQVMEKEREAEERRAREKSRAEGRRVAGRRAEETQAANKITSTGDERQTLEALRAEQSVEFEFVPVPKEGHSGFAQPDSPAPGSGSIRIGHPSKEGLARILFLTHPDLFEHGNLMFRLRDGFPSDPEFDTQKNAVIYQRRKERLSAHIMQKQAEEAFRRRNGLKMLVNGKPVDAFGDTGSTSNIVDEAWALEHKMKLTHHPTELVMGDGTKLQSTGTVDFNVEFDERSTPAVSTKKICAKVVKNFAFDLLLSRRFLDRTQTLTKYFSRFTTLLFPRLNSFLSMHLLSSTAGRCGSLFSSTFDDGIGFQAVLDTGSNCNVIDEDWAVENGLKVSTADHHRGWISLPSKGYVRTTGRVIVDMNLPGGRVVPMQFEVLKGAAVPVIIGVDTIFDYQLFTKYSRCFIDRSEEEEAREELFHMDYKSSWAKKVVERARRLFTQSQKDHASVSATTSSGTGSGTTSPSGTGTGGPRIVASASDEAERRWAWDMKYDDGKTATPAEWEQEFLKRYNYEKCLINGATLRPSAKLIKELPQGQA